MKHLISVVLCSFAFCASWSQVNIYNEDLVSKDSSLLFKDLINHISIDGSRQMKAIELSAEGALVSYVGPGKYLVHDVEADRVKLSVLKIENETNLPTLTLSTERVARIGTQVLVFGYPEPVTTNTFLTVRIPESSSARYST